MTSKNIEMGQAQLNPADEAVEPQKRYSSSSLVVAADELKFKTKKDADSIKQKEKEGKLSKKEAQAKLKETYKTLAHTYDKNALASEYDTDLKIGLTTKKYDEIFERVGPNRLTPPKQLPWWVRLLKSIFGGFFNVLLWFGSILCFIAYGADETKEQTNLYLGVVLAVVVTLTGIFSYFQESKSADLMSSLQAMNKTSNVEVIRDGKPNVIEPLYLVPGDVINIESGQAVPADVRLFECSADLEVNNASLTGESEPCKRDWRPEGDDIIPGEANNLMFFGTNIVNGKGKGVIFATGDGTFMGRTAALATSTENDETPIAKEIKDFVLKVSGIAFVLGISFFVIGMVIDGGLVRNVIFLIGIIVANVPEGLLATVTVSLTLTASKMFTKNVRVKNLESVETLGSTSVICSDKTGTLTTSIMTCQHVYYDLDERLCQTQQPMQALEGDFYDKDDSGKKVRRTDFLKLVRCGGLCNNADFVDDPSDPDRHGGVAENANPTEAAMVKFSSGHIAAEYQLSVPKFRARHEKLHEVPFNSKNKWQVSVHSLLNDHVIGDEIAHEPKADDDEKEITKRGLVQMKGAPERILDLCDRYLYEGKIIDLNQETRDKIMDGVLQLGGKGERVLALAELILDNKKYDINIPEPKCERSSLDDVDASYAEDDIVLVKFFEHPTDQEGKTIKVPIAGKDADGNTLSFENNFVWRIKASVAQQTEWFYDTIRLFYGPSTHETLAGDATLKDCSIKKGSIIYGYRGPFKFKGTKKDDVNFPFRRKTKELPYQWWNDNEEEVKNDDEVEEGLVFLGLYAMIDPPRSGVPDAVASCQDAGIRVIMVTGDHPVTAKAIARQVGIIADDAITKEDAAKAKYGGNKEIVKEDDYNAIVVPGWELAKVLEVEKEDKQTVEDFWNETLATDNIVFARTSPQQKLLIVTAVQERGGIVAVTGDGVNDSPALKKADIGCAMGITGTDVAKEAADMILLDDNFASIVNGVEEGRIIFDNLKKSIAYTLSSNIPEIAPFLIYQTLGVPLPLTTVMILLVDLGTDLAPAISMAYEGREANIMSKPPRNPEVDKLVTWRLVSFSYLQIGVLQALAGFYAYFVVLDGYGLYYKYLPRLDKARQFTYSPPKEVIRDSYWLWCWDGSEDNDGLWGWTECIYLPEFDFRWQITDYYLPEWYDLWIRRNSDASTDRAMAPAKDHLWKTCQVVPDCTDILFSRDLLAGKVITNGVANEYYYLTWGNSATSEALKDTACEEQGVDVANDDTCSIVDFEDVWKNYIEPMYHLHTGVFVRNRPNRRCEPEDYRDELLERHPGELPTPATCNTDPDEYPYKPRTWASFPNKTTDTVKTEYDNIQLPNAVTRTNAYSIYPMEMKTRSEALARANSAYFISIIVVQWADLMICKTRERSLFEQGMTNTFMNYALIFETILGAFLIYVPISNIVTQTRPMRFVWWAPGVPFSIMIYIYDEVRKGWIRKYRGGWLHKNTYW